VALVVSCAAVALPFAYGLYANREHVQILFPYESTGCVGLDPFVIEVVNDGGGPITLQSITFGLDSRPTDNLTNFPGPRPLRSAHVDAGSIIRSAPLQSRLDRGEFAKFAYSARTLSQRNARTVRVITATGHHYDQSVLDALEGQRITRDVAEIQRSGLLQQLGVRPGKSTSGKHQRRPFAARVERADQSLPGYPCAAR
jgi:hypothetical protein